MGAIAEAFVTYAQPLIDQTDGSQEQLERAFAVSQLCYNLARLPEDSREAALAEMRPGLSMNDEDFDIFRHSILAPMIRRYQAIFPRTNGWFGSTVDESGPATPAHPTTPTQAKSGPVTDRYAPCPCNSGEKYKFCCGAKGRGR